MATQILQTISMDERERIAYEEQLIYELDQRSEVASAVKANSIEIARTFKANNVPIDVILKGVPLTRQEVEAL